MTDINRNNYENFFLDYLDGELNPADRQSVEHFLSENPDLQKEFGLLKQTVLVPAEIVFADKELLFRKEEKRRVIPMYRMRIAAAVSVLVLGSWLLISQLTKTHTEEKTTEAQLASVNDSVKKNSFPENKKTKRTENSNQSPDKIRADKNQVAEKNISVNKQQKNNAAYSITNESNRNHPAVKDQQDQTGSSNQPATGIPEESITAARKSNSNLSVESAERQSGVESQRITAEPAKVLPALVITHNTTEPVQYTYAVAKESDEQSDNAISVLALDERNKSITGFFKKLTKRNPADDKSKKVHVSVFQFSY